MFVITNRRVLEKSKGLSQFGKTPNENRSKELRPAEVKKKKMCAISEGNAFIVHDVTLCLDDTNNPRYVHRVDEMSHNRHALISMKENDLALRLPRTKSGDAQRARLSNYIKRIDSKIAHCINQADASWVEESNSPFGGQGNSNDKMGSFFREVFSGDPGQWTPRYRAEGGVGGSAVACFCRSSTAATVRRRR